MTGRDPHEHDLDTTCPHCGARGDTAADTVATVTAAPTAPQPGAWTVCAACHEVGILDRSPLGVLRVRALTPTEQTEADHDRELTYARAALLVTTTTTAGGHA